MKCVLTAEFILSKDRVFQFWTSLVNNYGLYGHFGDVSINQVVG